MKVQAKSLSDEDRIKTLDALYTAAGSVRDRKTAKLFLRDLLTESERIMLGRRVLVARALIVGMTYDDIVAEHGVGKDTVRKISRWLKDQMPGYETVVAEVDKEYATREKKCADAHRYATSLLYRLEKRYPMHFLLFPAPKEKKST
ncbi:hypothetical protein KC727_02385 [Candidatus Kaiserbacteria bacterium]|nr:hypothetical protein [Candidatus Kaiserbacteria bacterium]